MFGALRRRHLAGKPPRFGGPTRAVGFVRAIELLPLSRQLFHNTWNYPIRAGDARETPEPEAAAKVSLIRPEMIPRLGDNHERLA